MDLDFSSSPQRRESKESGFSGGDVKGGEGKKRKKEKERER